MEDRLQTREIMLLGLGDAPPARHDPGGKVRLKIQPGVKGHALFSECGRYRHWLSRSWLLLGVIPEECPYVLWIAANPSTADSEVDDPTIRKIQKFSRQWGFDRVFICNVMDFRCTDPKGLLETGVIPCSDDNLDHIRRLSDGAALVVCAWGVLYKPLRNFATAVSLMLSQRTLWCVGVTKDNAPRHPLYVKDTTKPTRWVRA